MNLFLNTAFQIAIGTALLLIGLAKMFLVASAETMIALPTCAGRNLLISVNDGGFFAAGHCWGCYVAVAGSSLLVMTLHQYKKQSPANVPILD